MVNCRVILFPQPFVGHHTPMLCLGNALHSKGFSITIIQTHFNAPDPAKYPNFSFKYIEDSQSKSEAPMSDPLEVIMSLNASCRGPFRDCLAEVLEEAWKENEAIGCLILDPIWMFAAAVAEEFELPRIALRTGGTLAFVLYDTLPVLREMGYFPVQDDRKEDLVLEVPPLKVKDLPPEPHHEPLITLATEIKSCHHGIICNTFEELEGSTTLTQLHQKLPSTPIFLLGPLHKYSPIQDSPTHKPYIPWLNTHPPNSVLYVSFGTLATLTNPQLLEVARGLAQSEQPFLWALRPNSVDSFEPDEFNSVVNASKGLVVPWVSQQDVLANPAVGGFWTHCGWNSTLESVSEGVPMVCFPFLVDQMANARQVCDVLGVGVELEKGLERGEIERVVRRVMVEEDGEKMRKRVEELKRKVEECVMEGGSSYKSLNRLSDHIVELAKMRE